MKLEKKQQVYIQSFKHDGSLHRTWAQGYVVEAEENQFVAVTDKTWVIESDGRRWLTREPAICFFYPDAWFNVIAMIRKTGIYYYCNLASPSLYDGEAIKNIDYDLDVKVYPDGHYDLLDEDEYEIHGVQMNYSEELKVIIQSQLKNLLRRIQNKEAPFDEKVINQYYKEYQELRFK
ncbi:MAG: DUF402 domain-containing protein [Anaerorhabdus sp.]